MESCQPGVEVYNTLVVSGRLVPTKAEPPKRGTQRDAGNPNDGSSTSDQLSSSSGKSLSTRITDGTEMTSVPVPRRVKERVEKVAPQLYEQDRLAEALGEAFSTLTEAHHVARSRGVVGEAAQQRLRLVNDVTNDGKHYFGARRQPS